MQKFVKMLSDSCRELKKAQVLAAAAMFAALALDPKLCGLYPDRPLYQDRIFQYSQPAGGFPLGPVTGGLFAGILDIVKFFLKPDGVFFPGYTFNAILAAVIYGCFYYKKNLTLGRVLVAKGIVVIVVNLFLNTLWLSMLGGKAFMAILPPRLLKNIIMWPRRLLSLLRSGKDTGESRRLPSLPQRNGSQQGGKINSEYLIHKKKALQTQSLKRFLFSSYSFSSYPSG